MSAGESTKVESHRLFIDGAFVQGGSPREVLSPETGQVAAVALDADRPLLEQALSAADAAYRPFRRTSRYVRSRLLARMAEGIEKRTEDLAAAIVREAGKPVTAARAEVGRAVNTFTLAAEEAKRYGGEIIPVDADAAGRAYEVATSLFVPRGPVLAITPFNFPLNLVAHKIAPALAIGAPVLVKPAPQTPGPSRLLAEIFKEARGAVGDERESIPAAALQVMSAPNDVAALAVKDERIKVLSFTGSAAVGWNLQSAAKGKRVILELGGDAAVIVLEGADLARAAARCAFGAFTYAGQVCISVQRILVQASIHDRFRELFLAEAAKVKWGDPRDPATVSGPMINGGAADRIMGVLEEAQRGGGRLALGGARSGNLISPAVVEGAPPGSALATEEVFGPVVNIARVADIDEAIAEVNRSRYGLQAGLFTDSHAAVRKAIAELDVGGLLVNEVPTYRSDGAPYGGMKDSGLGREGVRYAMEECSERKTVIDWRG